MDNRCGVCYRPSSKLLVLSCKHDPCPSCALKQYNCQNPIYHIFQQNCGGYYQCGKCSELTKLDEQTINELKRSRNPKNYQGSPLLDSLRKSKSSSKRNMKFFFNSPRQTSTNSSQKIVNTFDNDQTYIFDDQSSRREYYRKRQECKTHEGEEKTFYCFGCYTAICAECAIHGTHFGHEVQAIKKAGNKIRKVYGQILSEAQRCTNMLSVQTKELNKLIEKFQEWNKNQRQAIKKMFLDLYELLSQKQSSLLRNIDEMEKQNLQKLQASKQLYDRLGSDLKTKRRSLMNMINGDYYQWDLEKLQQNNKQIDEINQRVNSFTNKKYGVKYLSSDIISEAIETIKELVFSFELEFIKN